MGDRQMTGEITIDLQLPDKMLRTDSMSPMGDAAIVVLTGHQRRSGAAAIRGRSAAAPGMMIRLAPPPRAAPTPKRRRFAISAPTSRASRSRCC